MSLSSSKETVAILYDIENAPFEMLNYTLGKARRFQPCRTIVVSDWDQRPDQKRWDKLMRRPGFTFRQISRTYFGKNSLDSALYDSAKILYDEGVRKYLIITTDSDFVRIAELLNSEEPSYIIGVGTKQASETLRQAYNEFYVYPPEPAEKKSRSKKKAAAQADDGKTAETTETKKAEVKKAESKKSEPKKSEAKPAEGKKASAKKGENHNAAPSKKEKAAHSGKENKSAEKAKPESPDSKNKTAGKKGKESKKSREKAAQEPNHSQTELDLGGRLVVNLPKTLRQELDERMRTEGVTLDELVTYLLMRGLVK